MTVKKNTIFYDDRQPEAATEVCKQLLMMGTIMPKTC
jgi:hypothetical protein